MIRVRQVGTRKPLGLTGRMNLESTRDRKLTRGKLKGQIWHSQTCTERAVT